MAIQTHFSMKALFDQIAKWWSKVLFREQTGVDIKQSSKIQRNSPKNIKTCCFGLQQEINHDMLATCQQQMGSINFSDFFHSPLREQFAVN